MRRASGASAAAGAQQVGGWALLRRRRELHLLILFVHSGAHRGTRSPKVKRGTTSGWWLQVVRSPINVVYAKLVEQRCCGGLESAKETKGAAGAARIRAELRNVPETARTPQANFHSVLEAVAVC